jgi:uncharacterized protein YkwD
MPARARLLSVLLGGAAACALTIPSAAVAGACADANLNPSEENRARLAKATLCLVNKERTKRGRVRLKANSTLARVASTYARQMVAGGFFDHVSPAGTTLVERVRRTSYLRDVSSWSIGENLAWGTGRLGTPAETVRAWMESPGHRRNILEPRFREIGIGVKIGVPVRVNGASGGATYTHVFGRRVKR